MIFLACLAAGGRLLVRRVRGWVAPSSCACLICGRPGEALESFVCECGNDVRQWGLGAPAQRPIMGRLVGVMLGTAAIAIAFGMLYRDLASHGGVTEDDERRSFGRSWAEPFPLSLTTDFYAFTEQTRNNPKRLHRLAANLTNADTGKFATLDIGNDHLATVHGPGGALLAEKRPPDTDLIFLWIASVIPEGDERAEMTVIVASELEGVLKRYGMSDLRFPPVHGESKRFSELVWSSSDWRRDGHPAQMLIGGSLAWLAMILLLPRRPAAARIPIFSTVLPRVKPVCGNCGYSVIGLESFTCPECGQDLRKTGIGESIRQWRRGSFVKSAVLTAIAMAVLCWMLGPIVIELIPTRWSADGRIGLSGAQSGKIENATIRLKAHGWGTVSDTATMQLEIERASSSSSATVRHPLARSDVRPWTAAHDEILQALRAAGIDTEDKYVQREANRIAIAARDLEVLHERNRGQDRGFGRSTPFYPASNPAAFSHESQSYMGQLVSNSAPETAWNFTCVALCVIILTVLWLHRKRLFPSG